MKNKPKRFREKYNIAIEMLEKLTSLYCRAPKIIGIFGAPMIFLRTVTYLFITFKILIFVAEWIPDVEDIPKTTDTFWKETTFDNLIDGSDGGAKVKVYNHPGSSYILCHDENKNIEYVYILQQDETIQDGIFRARDYDGNTMIGSKYFRRSGGEEDGSYLVRYNKSGYILYNDKIWDKDNSSWRTRARYNFNPETLDWTKELACNRIGCPVCNR